MSNYQDILDYLFNQFPQYQIIGKKAYKADLSNITSLCKIVYHPQKKLKCIHIAGTNGKGSVAHMLASVLQEAEYKVGIFTSPHLNEFRERIKINGEEIRRRNESFGLCGRLYRETRHYWPSLCRSTGLISLDIRTS